MRFFSILLFVLTAGLVFTACKKNPVNNTVDDKLSYGESVFYLKAQEYTISPLKAKQGIYRAFPDNLVIDSLTGKITVRMMGRGGESQTGLKYRVTFHPNNSAQVDTTYIVLAGINYIARIYRLSQNDTIISPVYNADVSQPLPAGNYGINPDSRLAINPANGQINISECIRRGMFDIPVENGEWEEIAVTYKSSDGSNNATNEMDIALYYYRSVNDIPSNVSTLMRAQQSQVLGVNQPPVPVTFGPVDNDLPDNVSLFKPRPPCVIIVGN